MPDDPPAPPAVPAAPPVAPPAAWHQGFDADTAAYITSKGLDKVDDWRAAFSNVANFHRQAEAYIGVPEAERLRVPNPADPAAQKAFWAKFGVPETPAGYDFSAVKFSDGSDLDPAFVETVQTAAHKYNVPVQAVTGLVRDLTGFLERQDANEVTAATERLTAQRAALQTLWGPNFQANLQLADAAAKRLGVDVDTAALLGEKIGADKVMEMFRKIGAATSEASFVAAPPRQGDGPAMTVPEAQGKLQALQGDREFGARLLAGDYNAKKEWDAAHRAAYPEVYASAEA